MNRTCTKCLVERPISEFAPRRDRPGSYVSHCRICLNIQAKDWYWQNREKKLAQKRKQYRDNNERGLRYGVTGEELVAMYERQDHRCAWCGRHERDLDKILYIDHCHNTGEVRRLLCFDCNTAEGRLVHFPEALAAIEAVAYYKYKED